MDGVTVKQRLVAMEALFDLLRAKGVTSFEGHWDGSPLSLQLALFVPGAQVEAGPKLAEPRRDDGLTAREAEDFYLSSGG